jgi:hypothetical protein
VRFFATLAASWVVGACASATRPAAVAPAACSEKSPVLWAIQSDARRVLRVSIDAAQGTKDGWLVDGKRRLAAAIAEWNAVGLPVRMTTARASDRSVEITVLVVPRLSSPSDDAMSRFHAGVTHLTYLASGEITRATVFVAEATPEGKEFSIADQMATLIHELGHALGLPHLANGVSVMSARPFVNGVTRHDERLARSLYQRTPDLCGAIAAMPGDSPRAR